MRLLVELALRVRERDRGGAVGVTLAAKEVRVIDEVGTEGVVVTESDDDVVDTDRLKLGEGEVVQLCEGSDDKVALSDGETVGDEVAVRELVTDGVDGIDMVALPDAGDVCDTVSEGVPDIERVRSCDIVIVIDGLGDVLEVAD